jgi:hypothetical protein
MRRLLLLFGMLLLAFGGFGGSQAWAQVDSSALFEKTLSLRPYHTRDFSFDTTFYHKPDTALYRVWMYDPALRDQQHAYLGVLGSAARPLLLHTGSFKPFQLGFNQYDVYRFDAVNRQYWNVSAPLTDFEFSSGGGNNQQYFKLFHTQNIGKTVNIGAEYRLMSTDGFYQEATMNNRNLSLFGSMVSPRKRYALHANYTTNNNLNEQNGGITPGKLFDSRVLFNPLGVPVNLVGAQSRLNDRNLYAEQQFRLSGADSSFTGIAVFHRIHYQRQYYNYRHRAATSDFYPAIFNDSLGTFDSTASRSMHNSVGLRSLALLGPWQWEVALHQQTAQLRTDSFSVQRQNLAWISAVSTYKIAAPLQISVAAEYVFANALQRNTHHVEASVAYEPRKNLGLSIRVLDQSQNPGWVSQRFSGNHQQQFNNFNAVQERALELAVDLPMLQLNASTRNIRNFVYFDALGAAQQYVPAVQVLQLGYASKLKLWKFTLDIQHGWQWGMEGPVRAPRFFNRDLLSFRHTFKAGWELQLGTEFRFQSNYLAPGYRPEIGQFVVQDSLQAGGAPIFDLFAAIKVKRTRIFVKFEHANQGFPVSNFYMVPLYPMYDRAFRFGLTWAFYN